MNKNHTFKLALAFTGVMALAGCVVPGPVAYQPVPPPAMVITQPGPVVAETEYVAAPSDLYITNVVDRDVVFIGGSTYIWYVGPDGLRHRHLYGHGDLRADVFHRREMLHVVMAHHDGHLPNFVGHEHGMPGHVVGHPPMMPHPEPYAAGPMHAPQPQPQMHPQAAMPPQMHPQPQPQMHQPAPHVAENSAHHPKQGG